MSLKLLFYLALWMILINRGNICIICLLYTSDAADDLLCVDLGGRRIIKKKKKKTKKKRQTQVPTVKQNNTTKEPSTDEDRSMNNIRSRRYRTELQNYSDKEY